MIHVTGWTIFDSLSSILISIFVLYTGSKLLYKCIKGLFFNGVKLPALKKIEKALHEIEHIDNVHNLIVKSEDSVVIVGAHIVLKHKCTLEKHDEICRFQIEKVLKEQFNIDKSVLQIETAACEHS